MKVVEKTQTLKMFIAGNWVDSEAGETFEATSPASGDVIAQIPKGTRADASRAVEAAHRARSETASLGAFDRPALLHRIADAMEQRRDTVAILLDHPVGETDDETINAGYLARVLGQDWGLHRTIQLNTSRVRAAAAELGVDATLVNKRLDELWQRIDGQPKSLKWKLRDRVGDRVSWYELPEEVRQPYQKD